MNRTRITRRKENERRKKRREKHYLTTQPGLILEGMTLCHETCKSEEPLAAKKQHHHPGLSARPACST
jgi:hypothetical protein